MAKSPRKPRVATAPEGETKAQKFSRLATARVNKVLKAIKNIGNLSTSGYEYTPEQVEKIEKLIKETTIAAIKRFDKTAAKTDESAVTI